MKQLRSLSTLLVLSTIGFSSFAQDGSPFKDGSVYRVLAGDAATKEDFDVMMLVELENMAALDETPEREAKWTAIREAMKSKVGGQEKVDGLRAAISGKRDFLGTKLMREQLHR